MTQLCPWLITPRRPGPALEAAAASALIGRSTAPAAPHSVGSRQLGSDATPVLSSGQLASDAAASGAGGGGLDGDVLPALLGIGGDEAPPGPDLVDQEELDFLLAELSEGAAPGAPADPAADAGLTLLLQHPTQP